MMPKNKSSNHNESTSLSNLNSVNNIMINYNQSKLTATATSLSSAASNGSGDERYGCRALICDSNGIIIGETAYRCMICAQINDSIAETKQHYYENHSNEFLLGPSANNLSNSLNRSPNGNNSNFITNSILNNSLNQSLNNGLSFSNSNNSFNQSNSLLNNNDNISLSAAKKRKNVADVLDKIYIKNAKNRNSTSLIQSTGNFLTGNGNKERDLFNFANNNLNNQLTSQINNQLNSLNSLNNINGLSNQLQLVAANDDYEEELDDQKSDVDNEDWVVRSNSINNLHNELFTNNSALLDAISKTSLYLKLNENVTDNLTKEIKNKSSKLIFNVDNSLDQDYSNTNIYDNMMNLNNDSENKDEILRTVPSAVKLTLKRGSTTANVGKPGHVSCAVCGVVRYYSCVYRRYGQFTCQVCYRFFRTFFAKPHRYTCTNLGSCPLDVRVRCRACWIQACINLYTVDGQRKQILDTYRPLNKASDDKTDNNNNSTNISDRNSNKQTNKNNLEDEDLDNSRISKKIKKTNFNDNQQQFNDDLNNGEDLVVEEDEDYDDLSEKQDDQEEPLNFSNKDDECDLNNDGEN